MGYTKAERIEIGRKIYTHQMTIGEAAEKFGLNWYTIRNYMRQYRDINNLPPMSNNAVDLKAVTQRSSTHLESLSKEELIEEIIKIRKEIEILKEEIIKLKNSK